MPALFQALLVVASRVRVQATMVSLTRHNLIALMLMLNTIAVIVYFSVEHANCMPWESDKYGNCAQDMLPWEKKWLLMTPVMTV